VREQGQIAQFPDLFPPDEGIPTPVGRQAKPHGIRPGSLPGNVRAPVVTTIVRTG
jgi:hypothetical protein